MYIACGRDDNMPTGINGFGFNHYYIDGSVHCDTTGMNSLTHKTDMKFIQIIEKFKDNYDEHFNTIDRRS